MYEPFVRVRGIDCVAWLLWLAAGALALCMTATVEQKALFGVTSLLAGMLATSATIAAAIRRTEERVSDQMTVEHRAQGDSPPTLLSRVR